jgi:hypothetical protein
MKVESAVSFTYFVGITETDADGFHPVVDAHDRMRTMQDQNLQLLNLVKGWQARAISAEKRFHSLRNGLSWIWAVATGLFLGYCLRGFSWM